MAEGVQLKYCVTSSQLADISDADFSGLDTAVVLGAGPAGLMSALMLQAEGYTVLIVEKRPASYTRLNVVTVRSESLVAFHALDLLTPFEERVGARMEKASMIKRMDGRESNTPRALTPLPLQDMSSRLNDLGQLPQDIFSEGGVYAVIVAEFEQFLANAALERGIRITFQADASILTDNCGHAVERPLSSVQVIQGVAKRRFSPHLVVVATGHSGTSFSGRGVKSLAPHPTEGEQWIVGTVSYAGKHSFTLTDAQYSRRLRHPVTVSIFNAKAQQAHVGVIFTGEEAPVAVDDIRQALETAAHTHFQLAKLNECPPLEWISGAPVKVANTKSSSLHDGGNVVLCGDQVGVSSPLVGLGLTLATSSYPLALRELARNLKSWNAQDRAGAFRVYESQCFHAFGK